MSEPLPPPPPPTGEPPQPPSQPPPTAGGGSSNRTLMLVLSYLGLFALIPFFMEKEDTEVRWHAKHGLVLFGAEILIFIVVGIVATMDLFGCVGCGIYPFLSLAILVLHVVCIVKAVNGERFLIPGLSDLADRF